MTWDPQGQGWSDTYGEGADQFDGVPSQTDGRPFYDGTEDALDFFFSTPASPYVPRPSLLDRHEPRGQAARAASRPASTPRTTRSARSSTRAASGIAGHSLRRRRRLLRRPDRTRA